MIITCFRTVAVQEEVVITEVGALVPRGGAVSRLRLRLRSAAATVQGLLRGARVQRPVVEAAGQRADARGEPGGGAGHRILLRSSMPVTW
jgi:hypothetical protein